MSVSDELRQAADKLTAAPHCGGIYSDCACDFAEQLAGLLRDAAAQAEQERGWSPPMLLLDTARRINRAEVAPADPDRVEVETTPLCPGDVGGYPLGRSAEVSA